MVVNSLYYGQATVPSLSSEVSAPVAEASGLSIDDDIIASALRNIYRRDFNPHADIEPNLFNAIATTLGQAVTTAAPSLGDDPFTHALRHSTDVFSAFKVHRAQNDMAARLLDSNGNLKPFEQWKEEVLPIANHQCHNWLETEYNTAVLRARQAANWQQFEAEKDILPNLKWLPSTSPNPGEDHRPFWNTILPIDHPFWDQHRPGDRWNCKCDLTSTDEQPTPVPGSSSVGGDGIDAPQPGLKDNPGKTQAVFTQDHPYFPADCKHCAFYNPTIQARLRHPFTARVKDCYHCPYIDGCIGRIMEKKAIDESAFARKREVEELNLMPLPEVLNIEYDNLDTGTLHLSGKSRDRFLTHAHHDYDVIAAVRAWNHPEELSFIEPSELGEGKDMNNPDDVRNVNKKWARGVRGYLKYRLEHNGRKFIVKTEKLKWGCEQFYAIMEE